MTRLQLLEHVLCVIWVQFIKRLNAFLYRDILKRPSCRPRGLEDVSQEEKEEAWDISAKELWTSCPHLLRRQARLFRGPADTMAKPDREPAQAKANGGPFQDHRSGAEAKEGTPHLPLNSIDPLTSLWADHHHHSTRSSLSYRDEFSFSYLAF